MIGIVVSACVESNDSISCPAERATLVCEDGIRLCAVGNDESLIGVVLGSSEWGSYAYHMTENTESHDI